MLLQKIDEIGARGLCPLLRFELPAVDEKVLFYA